METLRLMVKSILIIILMTAFLEIVLPRSDIKRYINLIIGLFIIIAALNPILAIFNTGFDFEVLSAVPEGITGDTEALINQGRGLARARDNRVAGDYKEKLEKQVMSLSGLYQHTKVIDVEVDMVADTGAPDFGKIDKIVLWIDDSEAVNSEEQAGISEEQVGIDEVKVNIEVGKGAAESSPDSEDSTEPENSANPGGGRGLREMVADFYGLSAEQVAVKKQEVLP